MGKTRNFSRLGNFITLDGSGNVVSTSVAAASVATARIAVYDNTTLKYRTPAQILTEIGALPLAGGTLTGPLVGTIASFTSTVTAGGLITAEQSAASLPVLTGSAQSTGHRFRLTTTGAATAVIDFGTAGGSGGWIQAANKSDLATTYPLLFNPNGGNVGVGVFAPSASLHITNSTAGTPSIPALGSINNYVAQYITNGAGGGSYGLMIGTLYSGNAWLQVQRSDNTAAAYNMILQPNGGNVGIGTSSPAVTLNVGNNSHGLGFAYLGSAALPALAGLYTSDGSVAGGGYGSLLIKSRTDYGGFYSIVYYTASADNVPAERMRITPGGVVIKTHNSTKTATLTKLVGISGSSSANISFDIGLELGVPSNGFVMVEISAIGYAGAGSGGLNYKAIVGGYSGHTVNTDYHKSTVYVNNVNNNGVSIYNPNYYTYGVSVSNFSASGLNVVVKLQVTWY